MEKDTKDRLNAFMLKKEEKDQELAKKAEAERRKRSERDELAARSAAEWPRIENDLRAAVTSVNETISREGLSYDLVQSKPSDQFIHSVEIQLNGMNKDKDKIFVHLNSSGVLRPVMIGHTGHTKDVDAFKADVSFFQGLLITYLEAVNQSRK